jgi:hypothetical protein
MTIVVMLLTAITSFVIAQTTEEKIADAMSAAPAAIAEHATIMDWPASQGAEMTVLREGNNGWVCYPSTPATLAAGGRDPWCLDEVSQAWFKAVMTQTEPKLEHLGLTYMLTWNGEGSNTDPFATGPTDDNGWHHDGPSLMIFLPDLSVFEKMSTDYQSGEPYVMFPGTPYAHLMVPLGSHADY